MIALLKAGGTVSKLIGEDTVAVPDLKLPVALRWTASLTDHGVPVFELVRNGKRVTMLLHGPHTIGAGTYYIVDAPKRVLVFLRERLGEANVTPLIRALRNRRAVRLWARAQGFGLVRNKAGDIVNVRSPLVICGNSGVDFDKDDEATAEKPGDME